MPIRRLPREKRRAVENASGSMVHLPGSQQKRFAILSLGGPRHIDEPVGVASARVLSGWVTKKPGRMGFGAVSGGVAAGWGGCRWPDCGVVWQVGLEDGILGA